MTPTRHVCLDAPVTFKTGTLLPPPPSVPGGGPGGPSGRRERVYGRKGRHFEGATEGLDPLSDLLAPPTPGTVLEGRPKGGS